MKKPLKIALLSAGGFTLLSGTFLLFAAMSGTPMHQIPGIGGFFPAPPEEDTAAVDEDPAPSNSREELAQDRRSVGQILERARSPLQAFLLPNPFSAGELENLADALKRQQGVLHEEQVDLARQRTELEEEKQHYRDLFAELEDLRSNLVRQSEEQSARAEEIQRDRDALAELERASFRSLATIYAEGKAKDMAAMLTAAYAPEQAALVLAALPEDRAAALLAEIHKTDPGEGAKYVDAYRMARTQEPAKK